MQNNGGHFEYDQDSEGRLRRAIYFSKSMLIYAQKFLDIVIIDSTYKRNRFNLPLVNIIGVNNLGQNILLAFALLTNETIESYDWVCQKLKRVWNKIPLNIICDECQSLNAGKNLNYYQFHLFRH